MKYLFVSDIHGSLPALQKALTCYRELHCDMLCLLGDILNYGPRNTLPEGLDPQAVAELLNAMSEDIVAVRGNCESEVDQMLLRFPVQADSTLIVDNGHRLFLTHGHIYNKEKMPPGRIDALFYGHTHLWELEHINGVTVCNTGSITFPKNSNPATIATYEEGVISIYTLDGTLLSTCNIHK